MEKIQKALNESAVARWSVLVLVASMMFFAYMFVDILSPLASLLEKTPHLGWNQGVFGTYAAGEYLLNVFGFLILAGIILDKMGVRFTGTLSASLMVIGAAIKYIGISEWFGANDMVWLNSWWPSMPGSAKIAMFGFMIFGCGCEMAGTTVSKVLAKWFKGKEMALAMGLEMSIARIGVFAAMFFSPLISQRFGVDGMDSVTAPFLFSGLLLVVGLLNYLVFCVMDNKFDKQLVALGESSNRRCSGLWHSFACCTIPPSSPSSVLQPTSSKRRCRFPTPKPQVCLSGSPSSRWYSLPSSVRLSTIKVRALR